MTGRAIPKFVSITPEFEINYGNSLWHLTMSGDRKNIEGKELEHYRGYLHLLASQQVAPRFRGKIDLSGVVQETLFEAQREVTNGLNVPSRHRLPWLRRILANNLGDELRRATADKRDMRREVPLHQSVETSSHQLELWLARDLAPGRAVEKEECVLRLAASLGQLPEPQQAALILHYWSGWTLSEIAEHLQRSRDAVAGLIKRGVQTLRQRLTDEDSHYV